MLPPRKNKNTRKGDVETNNHYNTKDENEKCIGSGSMKTMDHSARGIAFLKALIKQRLNIISGLAQRLMSL